MLLGRSYRLSASALKDLKAEGMREDILERLQRNVNHKLFKKQEFLDHLQIVGNGGLSEPEKQWILRTAQLSLLRLERMIPNRGIREWVDALVFALVIALMVRTFVLAPFKIPSGSMIPTIKIGDHIFATMFSYGLPVPFTDTKLFPQEIERGDIVIFPFPGDPSVDYIKRVVARGGESIAVKGTTVYIDGVPQEEPFAYHDENVLNSFRASRQNLPEYGPLQVPEGMLFVMGDNRFNSSDSRVWGFVRETTVKGKALIIYWSHDPREGLTGGYRLNRIASLLH